MNRDFLLLRSSVVKTIRRFFDERGYAEMHTPRLVGLPGQEPYLEPLWTEVHGSVSVFPPDKGGKGGFELDVSQPPRSPLSGGGMSAALITSPEYAMKKLLGAGFDKIYDLGPCFRDGEPWDGSHDVEFLMLEWYRKNVTLADLMDETEEMVKYVYCHSRENGNPGWIPAGACPRLRSGAGMTKTPFRRLTVADAMKRYANVDLDPLLENREAMAEVVRAHGQTVDAKDTWDDLFFKILLSEVEPKLGFNSPRPPLNLRGGEGGVLSYLCPTFLYNYPASMAALAKKNPDDPRYALRVELYIGKLELANGFVELTDAEEQRMRFEEDRALRASLGKKTWPLDERFLEALPRMGEAVGIAFGVDRLAMLLAGTDSISDLMPIPVRERFP